MADSQPSPPARKPVTGRQRSLVIFIDKLIYAFSRRWLLVFNVIVGLYVGLPILAPVLMNAGAEGPAKAIYVLYSPMCHQMATRSFFLFGDQYAYPRELAGSSLTPIEGYTAAIPELAGVDQSDENWAAIFAGARAFLGNETLGYKMALCERDIAIYGFILLGGIGYAFLRKRYDVKPLPLWAFVIIGMGPIGLDGFSQLFGYMGIGDNWLAQVMSIFPVRESPPWLRFATGAWFGLTLAWLAYPNVEGGMKDTARELKQKLTKAGALD